ITSAKPRCSVNRVRSRVMSGSRAVAEVDGVGELVRLDRAAPSQADRQVDGERGQTAAAGRVREGREHAGGCEVVPELEAAGRTAPRPELAVEAIAVRVAGDGNGAPADVAAAAAGDLQGDGAGCIRADVRRAVDVAPELVQRETRRLLRLKAVVLL